jgi:hypothetical protein
MTSQRLNVVEMAGFRNRELIATLRDLLDLAEAGAIMGHAFVVKFGPGDHRAGFSGEYKRQPAEALTATFMLERHLSGTLPPLYESNH